MSALAHSADRHADFVRWMENRARYIAQSAATKAGSRAEIPPRELAPIVGNEYDWYAAEQSPQEPITNYADRRGF